jgi:hypothetical protein
MTVTGVPCPANRGKLPILQRVLTGQPGNSACATAPAQPLKARFQRALYQALEMPPSELERATPESAIEAVAVKLVLDAVAGRTASRQQLLSLLDKEIGREETGEEEIAEELPVQAEPERNETSVSSLLQGESQGGEKNRRQMIGELPDAEEMAREAVAETAMFAARSESPPERTPIRATSPLAARLLQGTSCPAGFGAGATRAWAASAQGP